MSAFQKLLYILSPILLFLIGIGHIGRRLVGRFAPESWQVFLESQISLFLPPVSLWLFWILAFAVPLCLAVILLRRVRSRELLVVKTRSGHLLKVRQSAVNRHIQDRLKRLPHIRKLRIQTWTQKHGLHVAAQIWTASDRALDAVQDEVRTRIINDCKQGLGVAQVYDPDLQFESLAEDQSFSSEEGEPKRLAPPLDEGSAAAAGIAAPWSVPQPPTPPQEHPGESAARYRPPSDEKTPEVESISLTGSQEDENSESIITPDESAGDEVSDDEKTSRNTDC